jgi:hypothetical protein
MVLDACPAIRVRPLVGQAQRSHTLHALKDSDPYLRCLGGTVSCAFPGGWRRGEETIVGFARAQGVEPNSDATGVNVG